MTMDVEAAGGSSSSEDEQEAGAGGNVVDLGYPQTISSAMVRPAPPGNT